MTARIISKLFFFLIFVVGGQLMFSSFSQAAIIIILPENPQIYTNQTNELGVYIDTETDNSTGADAHISYDSSKIEILSVTQGSLYGSYPTKTFNTTMVDIGAVSSDLHPYNGSGLFATISYRALSAGTTTFSFIFTQGGTTNTTVSLDGRNLLTRASGSTLTITDSGNSTPTPTPTPVTSGAVTPTVTRITDNLPRTGIIDDIAGNKITLGIVFMILGSVLFIDIRKKSINRSGI